MKTLEYYTQGSENQYYTFIFEGTDSLTEDYYSFEVDGELDHNTNCIHIEGTDTMGYEYPKIIKGTFKRLWKEYSNKRLIFDQNDF